MTIYRGTVMDTPDDPFTGGVLRVDEDAGLLVQDGTVRERGPFAAVSARHPDEEVVDLRSGLLLPGLVDTHVHYPQVRAIAGLGMPLLDWLDRCALPEEERLADLDYGRATAAEFCRGLVQAGTTTALVFGSHFATAMDALFGEAQRVGIRVTSGLVVSNRTLPESLLTTPQRAYDEGLRLAKQWHRVGRLRYAVTPRFSLSCDDEMLGSCTSLLADVPGAFVTTHINENPAEVAEVARAFAIHGNHGYLASYERHGLVGPRTVLAHNVHATDAELATLGQLGGSVAHCPTSNAALGSGMFPLRGHVDHGVRVALGSDVGAGTGFSLFKEALQAYFFQQLLGPHGLPLSPAHLLHLSTSAGAAALGLDDEIGDLGVGRRFDAVWVSPARDSTLDLALRTAGSPDQALAKTFAMASPADVASVWVQGDLVSESRLVPAE